MTFLTAFVSEVGISIAMAAEYLQDGTEALYTRLDRLGDYVESQLAVVFNISLLSAGSSMLLAMYGLYSLKSGAYTNLIAIFGFFVGLSTLLLGLFPVNYMMFHKLAGLSFLVSLIGLYGLCVVARIKRVSLCDTPMFILSLIGLISSSIILSQYDWAILDVSPCLHLKNEVCWTSVTIIIQVQVIILWCASLAYTLLKQLTPPLNAVTE